jgi:hypothetical protein
MSDQPSKLSHDYVFNYVFKKLADTVDRYRNLVREMGELETALNFVFAKYPVPDLDDLFHITLEVIDILKVYGQKSKLANEIFENVRRDFWHQLKPEQYSRHEGRYYIDSVADELKLS